MLSISCKEDIAVENSNPIVNSEQGSEQETKNNISWKDKFPLFWSVAYANEEVDPKSVTYEQFLKDLSSAMEKREIHTKPKIEQIDYWFSQYRSSPEEAYSKLRGLLVNHTLRKHFLNKVISLSGENLQPSPEDESAASYLLMNIKKHSFEFKLEYLEMFIDNAIYESSPFIHQSYHSDVFTGIILIDKENTLEVDTYLELLIKYVKKDYGHEPDDELKHAFQRSHFAEYSRLCYLAKYALEELPKASPTKIAELKEAFTGRTPSSSGTPSLNKPACTYLMLQ